MSHQHGLEEGSERQDDIALGSRHVGELVWLLVMLLLGVTVLAIGLYPEPSVQGDVLPSLANGKSPRDARVPAERVGAVYLTATPVAAASTWVRRLPVPFVENAVQPDTLPGRLPREQLPDMTVKKERVNILLLGTDGRPGDAGPSRSDTMILVSVDPANDSVTMLSIPRDLWVPIPGYGESRVNVAHFLGDWHNHPGGGPGLAKTTVAQAFGLPVHYYVRVDFAGFQRLVDAIGGVTVELDRALPPYAAGTHQLDGAAALQFARTRQSTNDFTRLARQQELLMAAYNKMRKLDMPLSAITELLRLANDTVATDLSLSEMLSLVAIARRIEPDDIRRAAIDASMTTAMVTPLGWMVEVPRWEAIRPLVDELFDPDTLWATDANLVGAELAGRGGRIALVNGTPEPELAEAVAELLGATGFHVVEYQDAERDDLEHTSIVAAAHAESQATILALTLGMPGEVVRVDDLADYPDVDILVILGLQHLKPFGFS